VYAIQRVIWQVVKIKERLYRHSNKTGCMKTSRKRKSILLEDVKVAFLHACYLGFIYNYD